MEISADIRFFSCLIRRLKYLFFAGCLWVSSSHGQISFPEALKDRNDGSERNNSGVSIDDIMQHTPAVSVFALNVIGLKGKHGFLDRVIILGTSTIIMVPSVYSLKKITQVERPDGSGKDGFPSGHSSFAFMGAEFMRLEYEHLSPWPGILAYSLAATTGLIRLYDRKHRPLDVFAGAFAGIISIRLAYILHPVIADRLPFYSNSNNKDQRLSLIPWYEKDGMGLIMRYAF